MDYLEEEFGKENLFASFYNPNIEPPEELLRRADAFVQVCHLLSLWGEVTLQVANFDDHKEIFEQRCFKCYSIRLGASMLSAKQRGFDFFTTTLLASPTQKHDVLINILERLERELLMKVYYFEVPADYYKNKVNELRKKGVYVQNYCGCYGSLWEQQERRYEFLWR
jgi:predicted adenine nucleotide alpha hydrolase (AANH) superfamily ATPase